jgi:transcriptional regulator with GAF, ATPase, and Fis domain
MPSLKWIAPTGPSEAVAHAARPRLIPIVKKVTSLGRAPGNDVVLDAPEVRDFHARVMFDGRDFVIEEADPTGDILVNGKKKRRVRLTHGDPLKLGGAELWFSMYEDPSAFADSSSARQDASSEHSAMLRNLRKLHEFSERLMETTEVQSLLTELIDAVVEITHADKGFVILLRGTTPEIVSARTMRQTDLPDGIRHLSDSILTKVIQTQKPLIVSDALADEQFSSSESVMNLKLSSVMCAPLMVQGKLLGLLYVGNDSVQNLFDPASLEVFLVFAGQASLILQKALVLDELQTDRDTLAKQLVFQRFGDIIASGPSMGEVLRSVEKVAPAQVSVLVTGETGTGKELIAREIHRRSPRGSGPFVVVNCGAIPENLVESELFGHVRGAFTGAVATREGCFQAAHKGTLFLDEVGELPLPMQVKLLRALQEHVVIKVGDTRPEQVDIRVVAATNRSLKEEIRAGRFREDLYYRLNVVHIHLPPLRDRGEDVVVIAKFFLDKYAREFQSTVKGFSAEALVAIKKYEWPGNIRQLENRVKRAIVLCDRNVLSVSDLDLDADAFRPIVTLAQAKEDFQRRYILEVLDRNNGNRTKTAQDLGVDPRTVFRYLERDPTMTDSSGAETE